MTSSDAEDDVAQPDDNASVTKVGQGKTIYLDAIPVVVRSVPQCITCQCNERELVEQGVMGSRSYRSVALSLPKTSRLWVDGQAPEGVASVEKVIRRISEHFQNGHGNGDMAVSRLVMEAVAKAQGLDTEAMVGTIVHEYGVLTEVQRRGFEDFVKSDDPVPLSTMLRATETLLRYREVAQTTDGSVFQEAIESIFGMLGQMLNTEEMQWIFSGMQADSTVDAAFRAIASESQT